MSGESCDEVCDSSSWFWLLSAWQIQDSHPFHAPKLPSIARLAVPPFVLQFETKSFYDDLARKSNLICPVVLLDLIRIVQLPELNNYYLQSCSTWQILANQTSFRSPSNSIRCCQLLTNVDLSRAFNTQFCELFHAFIAVQEANICQAWSWIIWIKPVMAFIES